MLAIAPNSASPRLFPGPKRAAGARSGGRLTRWAWNAMTPVPPDSARRRSESTAARTDFSAPRRLGPLAERSNRSSD